MSYADETIQLAREASIQETFIVEVDRLLNSGAVDREKHSRGLLFGVALENIADRYLRGERKTRAYRNLIKF